MRKPLYMSSYIRIAALAGAIIALSAEGQVPADAVCWKCQSPPNIACQTSGGTYGSCEVVGSVCYAYGACTG